MPDTTPVTPGVADAAGRQIAAAASDPAAVQAATALPPEAPLVPGSQPTTFQQTGDTGLGQLERGLRQIPGPKEAFIDRDNANNAARVNAIAGTAPSASATSDLVDSLAAQRDALAERAAQAQQAAQQGTLQDVGGTSPNTPTQAGNALRQAVDDARAPVVAQADQAVQQGQGQLSGALDKLGGVPSGDAGSALQQYGAGFRNTLATQRAVQAGQAGSLFDALADKNLALPVSPIQQAQARILGDMGSTAKPPAGEEAAIYDTVAKMPATSSFKDVGDLNTRIGNALRAERSSPTGDPQTIRRLGQLQGSIHDAIEGASNLTDVPAAPAQGGGVSPTPSPSASTGQGPASAPAVGDAVYTPSGQRVGVRYELADAGNLVTSNGADGSVNPNYPQVLQPRDRTRAASQLQVQRIAGDLQPERLGASSTAADGAPIIGPDGVVESGNGRVAAIRQAYAQGGPSADRYRAWLESQGHDTTGMQQPVLVRRRTTPLTPEGRQQFAAEANVPTVLAQSATERAAGDAGRLTPDVLDTLKPGDVTSPANRDFVRNYVRQVVEPGQEGSFVGADGSLSQEGAARMRAALTHKAYGDAGLVSSLAESTDPHAKVLAGALQDAAPAMAKLRASIERGETDPSVDIAPSLVEAARVVQSARQRGISLADAVAQQDAFNPISDNAARLLREAYGDSLSGRMSREGFADGLALYAQRAAEQHATVGNLFGTANLTAEQLLDGTTGRYGRGTAQARQSSDSAGFAGAGDRSAGTGTGRLSATTSGASDTGGSRGGSGSTSSRVLPSQAGKPPLTPNFDSAAAQDYATARAAYRDLKDRFDRAPGVGNVLKSGPMAGTYATGDSLVPGALLEGKGAAEKVQAAVRAGVLPYEVSDYYAHTLRLAAGTEGGGIDPAKATAWLARNREGLDALGRVDPQSRGAFDTVAGMARQVADLRTSRNALDVAHPLAKMQDGSDVMAKVITKGPAGAGKLGKVLDAAGNAPDAIEAASDHLGYLLRAEAAPGGVINPKAYAAFQRNYAGALSVRPEIKAQFDTAASAQRTLDEQAARHADNLADYQKSAAGSLLNGVPPDRAVGSILRSDTALPRMTQLARLTAGDPPARAGLQRAVVDHITSEFGSNAAAGDTGTTVLKSDAFQTFIRKNDAALRQVMTPQQMDAMGKVAADLQRAARSNQGTKAAVGSDTQQNRGIVGSLLDMAVDAGFAKSIGVLAGAFHAGWPGALGGEKVGVMVDNMIAQFRSAGIRQTSDLVSEAMLNPALANVLLSRVTNQSRPNVAKSLGVALGRVVAANAGAGLVTAENRGRR